MIRFRNGSAETMRSFRTCIPDVVICTDRRSAEETGRTIFALAEVFMTDHTQP